MVIARTHAEPPSLRCLHARHAPSSAAAIDTVRRAYGPGTTVSLFGSRLDDEARGSDVDLLVETDAPPTLRQGIRVKALVEEAEDAADCGRAIAQDDGVRYPAAVALAMAEGAHPLEAWREQRGTTLQALAAAAGVSKPYVSQIESGKRTGRAATPKKLAAALDAPVAALLPP